MSKEKSRNKSLDLDLSPMDCCEDDAPAPSAPEPPKTIRRNRSNKQLAKNRSADESRQDDNSESGRSRRRSRRQQQKASEESKSSASLPIEKSSSSGSNKSKEEKQTARSSSGRRKRGKQPSPEPMHESDKDEPDHISLNSDSQESAPKSQSDSAPKLPKESQNDSEEDSEDEYDDEYDQDDDMGIPQDVAESFFAAATSGGVSLEALLRSNASSSSSANSNPMAGRIRALIATIKSPADATARLLALQGLSEILSIASEEMFSSSSRSAFNTQELVSALIGVFDSNLSDAALAAALYDDESAFGFGAGSAGSLPDLMLLACRCLSNLIEANPSSSSNIVQQRGVETLVSKLLEIEYIDLAEQILSVLERISIDYPSAILRANGLVAVLQYIDFFSIHVQRSAMTTAANACRGLTSIQPPQSAGGNNSENSLTTVLSVLETVTRMIASTDKKLAEQAVRCLGRIVDWVARDPAKVDLIATPAVLDAVVGLLATMADRRSGQENAIVFESLLRIVARLGKSSAKCANDLVLHLGILSIIRNILTGGLISAEESIPLNLSDTTDADARAELKAATSAALINSIVNRSTDQILDILNVPASLLPTLPKIPPWRISSKPQQPSSSQSSSSDTPQPKESDNVNLDLLSTFVRTLLPLLFDVFGATVSLAVRRKVVDCVSRCIWFCTDIDVLSNTLHACRGFGKFVFELVSLHEAALPESVFGPTTPTQNVSISDDNSSSDSKNNALDASVESRELSGPFIRTNDARDALLLMIAGLQIAIVAVDKCGSPLRTWLEREGVIAEIRKISARSQSAMKHLPSSDTIAASQMPETPELRRLGLVDLIARIESQTTNSDSSTVDLSEMFEGVQFEEILRELNQIRDGLSSSSSSASPSRESLERLSTLVTRLRDRAGNASAASSATQASPSQRSSSQTGSPSRPTLQVPFQHAITGLDGERFTERDAFDWIAHNVAEFLKNVSADKPDSGVLARLSSLAARLHALGSDSNSVPSQIQTTLVCLRELAQHFAGSQAVDDHHGLTGFELATSGIIDILVDFMTAAGINDSHKTSLNAPVASTPWSLPLALRLQCFAHVFLGAPTPHELVENSNPSKESYFVPNALRLIVVRLEELVSRSERVRVINAFTPINSSGTSRYVSTGTSASSFLSSTASGFAYRDNSSPSMQLTRQMRLRLTADTSSTDMTIPKQLNNVVVSIHAVASLRALENYLVSRLETEAVSTSSSSRPKPTSDKASSSSSMPTNANPETSQEELAGKDVVTDMDEDEDDEIDDIDEDVSVKDSNKPSSSTTSTPSKPNQGSSSTSHGGSYAAAASVGLAANSLSVEFEIGGEIVSNDSTIFGALYRLAKRRNQNASSSDTENDKKDASEFVDIWLHTHPITYRVVRGAADKSKPIQQGMHASPSFTPTIATCVCSVCAFAPVLSFPESVDFKPLALHALYLLRILYSLNRHAHMLFSTSSSESTFVPFIGTLTPSEFYNNKLAAKLSRQLDEPLMVVSDVLPSWCRLVVEHFAFMLPLELRASYLQATAYGYSRSLLHWQHQQQNQQHGYGGQASGSRFTSGGSGTGQGGGSSEQGRSLPFGRVARRKIRLSRSSILESMFKTMLHYGASTTLLEFEFFDEVGTGLGPTLEFYALVARDLRAKEGVGWPTSLSVPSKNSEKISDKNKSIVRLNIWRATDSNNPYMDPPGGLYPSSLSSADSSIEQSYARLFFVMGVFVAKALMDSRVLDLRLSPLFLEQVMDKSFCDGIDNSSNDSFADSSISALMADLSRIQPIDSVLARSMRTLVKFLETKRFADHVSVDGVTLQDLSLDMTLPGRPDVELVPGGANVSVTIDNLERYIRAVVDLTVGRGVRLQTHGFRQGFQSVLDVDKFKCLSGHELSQLISGGADHDAAASADWSTSSLRECIRADHGYHADSRIILQLTEMMSNFSVDNRRLFLRFVTGTPKLPFGGFKALSPPLTVVRKVPESGHCADDYLPSVMTCAHYLKVPEYSSLQIMTERFTFAMREGQGSFHLS